MVGMDTSGLLPARGNRAHDLGPDQLKGILLVLVIFGHTFWQGVGESFAKWMIYGFHMPAFLFLSGYLIAWDRFGERSFGTLVRHYWRRMLAAWLVVSLLWNVWQTPEAFSSVRAFVHVMFLEPSFHLWYVPMLFGGLLLLRLLGGSVGGRSVLALVAVGGALLFQTPLRQVLPDVLVESVDARYLGYLVWFVLGVAVRNRWVPHVPLVAALAVAGVGLAARAWSYDHGGTWFVVLAFTVLSVGAALCVPAFREALRWPVPVVGAALAAIGRQSLYVYLLHPFVTNALRTPETGWLRSMLLGGCVTIAIVVTAWALVTAVELRTRRRSRVRHVS
jgi:fucose 4-O-acetylase-like acetyltransferase